MVSADGVAALEQAFQYVDENTDGDDDIPDARKLFRDHMGRSGGEIDTLEAPRVYREPASDLAKGTLFNRWYGVDASTIPPKKFRNGMIASAAVATAGALGQCDVDVENTETIVMAVHAKLEGESPVELLSGEITLTLVAVDKPPTQSEVDEWVGSSARVPAECWHSEQLAERIDGPLFIDGSLYPRSVLPFVNLVRTQYGDDGVGGFDEIEQMGVAASAIQARIDAIDTLALRGYPTLAFTKTLHSDDIVAALDAKSGAIDDQPYIPWDGDSQFVSALLSDDEPDHLTFTSWLVRTHQRVYGNDLEPLGGFNIPEEREAQDFRRAFFFVRLPDGVVIRVEAPFMLVNSESDRIRLQQLALARIAEANDVPFSVKRADDRARISHETKQYLIGLLKGTEEIADYNQDRRWGLQSGPSLAREPELAIPGNDSVESDERAEEQSIDQPANNINQ